MPGFPNKGEVESKVIRELVEQSGVSLCEIARRIGYDDDRRSTANGVQRLCRILGHTTYTKVWESGGTQTLWCERGRHDWERPRVAGGRLPRSCSEHAPAHKRPKVEPAEAPEAPTRHVIRARQETMTQANALRILRAIHLDPVDAGL